MMFTVIYDDDLRLICNILSLSFPWGVPRDRIL